MCSEPMSVSVERSFDSLKAIVHELEEYKLLTQAYSTIVRDAQRKLYKLASITQDDKLYGVIVDLQMDPHRLAHTIASRRLCSTFDPTDSSCPHLVTSSMGHPTGSLNVARTSVDNRQANPASRAGADCQQQCNHCSRLLGMVQRLSQELVASVRLVEEASIRSKVAYGQYTTAWYNSVRKLYSFEHLRPQKTKDGLQSFEASRPDEESGTPSNHRRRSVQGVEADPRHVNQQDAMLEGSSSMISSPGAVDDCSDTPYDIKSRLESLELINLSLETQVQELLAQNTALHESMCNKDRQLQALAMAESDSFALIAELELKLRAFSHL